MDNYEIVPYEARHAAMMENLHPEEAFAYPAEALEVPGSIGVCRTLMHGDRPLCYGGGYVDWQGVGTVFFVCDPKPDSMRDSKEILKACRLVIENFRRTYDIQRLQASCNAGFRIGQRFMEKLGFTAEAVLEKYGPDGSDHVMYKRIYA